jgi:hypothetical protein
MSSDDGIPSDLHRRFTSLDDATATRLLDGQVDPADAPPSYAAVATILVTAAAPARPGDLAGESAALAAFHHASAPSTPRPRSRSARLVALVAAGVVVLGGGAAAVIGSLPKPAQSVAHDALGAVGVSIPAPASTHKPVRPTPPWCRTRPCPHARPPPHHPGSTGPTQPTQTHAEIHAIPATHNGRTSVGAVDPRPRVSSLRDGATRTDRQPAGRRGTPSAGAPRRRTGPDLRLLPHRAEPLSGGPST